VISLPIYSWSNKKLNDSICLSFMYITCKKSTANLKLIDNLIDSPDTSTVYGELPTEWLDCRTSNLLVWSSDGMTACHQWRNDQLLMSPHKFWSVHINLGPPIKLFCHYAFLYLGTPDTHLQNRGVPWNPVWETLLQS